MNKHEFLKELRRKLRKLKKEERTKYLDYYDEMISDIMEKGVSEEEAIRKQGEISQIAAEILSGVNPSALKIRDWKGICLILVSVVLLSVSLIPLIFRMRMQLSLSTAVGIIGGADGPTSIFIAGKIGTPWGLYIATAVVVIAAIVYFAKKRKKK